MTRAFSFDWPRGVLLERRYRERPGRYFGRVLRRVRMVDLATLEDALEAALSPAEGWEEALERATAA